MPADRRPQRGRHRRCRPIPRIRFGADVRQASTQPDMDHLPTGICRRRIFIGRWRRIQGTVKFLLAIYMDAVELRYNEPGYSLYSATTFRKVRFRLMYTIPYGVVLYITYR